MSVTNQTNSAAIGRAASIASRSHGASRSNGGSDGRMTPRGGPHDPNAGAYEEPRGERASRLGGIEDLKTSSMCYGPMDGCDPSMPPPLLSALGMNNGPVQPPISQQIDYFEMSRN